jgi:hypothetical protein
MLMMHCTRYRPVIEAIFPPNTGNSGRTSKMRSSPLDASKCCDSLPADERQITVVRGG